MPAQPLHRIPVGISTCLLGEPVRHDGSHRRDRYLVDVLGDYFDWVPTCPEMQSGLGTPRESLRQVRNGRGPRLITNGSDIDLTGVIEGYARQRLPELARFELRGYVLKSGSPTCGMERVRLYDADNVPSREGTGVFARLLRERFPRLPVEEDGRLNDPRIRENFITRVFAYDRWLTLRSNHPQPRDVVAFHTAHKLLMLAHSPAHYEVMGPLVAKAGVMPMDELLDRYEAALLDGLREIASPGRHANVLEHIAGFLKRDIPAGDKRQLHDSIRDYRLGRIPLVAPLMLLHHYLRHLRDDWLDAQVYLRPYPEELALRSSI